MSIVRPRKKRSGDIDISPLIDVVFILLIFFMVSTTFIKDTQLDLERPSAASGTKASTAALRVVLDQRGQLRAARLCLLEPLGQRLQICAIAPPAVEIWIEPRRRGL